MTNSVFPMKKGTELVVNCEEGYTLTSGDRLITCQQDAEYTSPGSLPVCTIGERTQIFIIFTWQSAIAVCVQEIQVAKTSRIHRICRLRGLRKQHVLKS